MKIPYIIESITVDENNSFFKRDKDGSLHIITSPMKNGTRVDVIAYVEQNDDELEPCRPAFAKWIKSDALIYSELLIVNNRHVATVTNGYLDIFNSKGGKIYTCVSEGDNETAKILAEQYFAKKGMYGYRYKMKIDEDVIKFLVVKDKCGITLHYSDYYSSALNDFNNKEYPGKAIYAITKDYNMINLTPESK